MANMIVMYTLKREGGRLLGPINRWIYASFATKEHAFQIARREANKRGFTKESGKLVQFVTDGDIDLGRNIEQYFPEAMQTIDFIHVAEKLWEAGTAVFEEGTREHRAWYAEQRGRVLDGQCHLVLQVLVDHDRAIPRTGPGNKGRHQRLLTAMRYIAARLEQMDYAKIIDEDLEYSTGQIEGIIKNVIARRCDHGGMRWIPERVEALLQLRCIEINGDWDAFVGHVHDERLRDMKTGTRTSLLTGEANRIETTPNAEAKRQRRLREAEEREAYLTGAAA